MTEFTFDIPMIGAQVFIEPGQKAAEIETWFSTMHKYGLDICRIRLFESYMRNQEGSWDFSLFDLAYEAAEKYNIKVFGTLFPATTFEDVGGFKFPRSEEHFRSIAYYIRNLITHFKQFKSCAGWVLINEPGSGSIPDERFSQDKLKKWKEGQTQSSVNPDGYHVFHFEQKRFLLDYNTWYLKWLADEIYKYDPGSHLHVNNHNIFQNIQEYDFPKWREFLSTLGGSGHASWHFGYFERSQYAMAMSANAEIIYSGAGNIPWLMTELQGGNNTYSAYAPMCPTREEIYQWLWTIIGTGGKGGIFWCLNPRASGYEAGEWAMIDFQNGPSDRLLAASDVANVLRKNPSLFADAKPVESGVNLIYTRETFWIEENLQTGGTDYEGRKQGGAMKSVLGYFEACCEMGIQCSIKEINEFDFARDDYHGITIILAHQISLPSAHWKNLENYVRNGGKLLVDGLTAYYDEDAHCIMKTGFPLEVLFGGVIKEFKVVDNLFNVALNDPVLILSAHLWRGSIHDKTSKPIARFNNEAIATRNTFGNGEVLWMPSMIGLGSRISGYEKLIMLLDNELNESMSHLPFRFKAPHQKMLMKTLKSGNSFITILINKNTTPQKVQLEIRDHYTPKVLFADQSGMVSQANIVSISPEETVVISWHEKDQESNQ
jgi:beta-galactosidase